MPIDQPLTDYEPMPPLNSGEYFVDDESIQQLCIMVGSELKAIGIGIMYCQEGTLTATEYHNDMLAIQGDEPTFVPGNRQRFRIMLNRWCEEYFPDGAAPVVRDNNGGTNYFELTDLGREITAPFAGLVLDWSLRNEIPLLEVFRQSKRDEKMPTPTLARLGLMAIIRSENEQSIISEGHLRKLMEAQGVTTTGHWFNRQITGLMTARVPLLSRHSHMRYMVEPDNSTDCYDELLDIIDAVRRLDADYLERGKELLEDIVENRQDDVTTLLDQYAGIKDNK